MIVMIIMMMVKTRTLRKMKRMVTSDEAVTCGILPPARDHCLHSKQTPPPGATSPDDRPVILSLHSMSISSTGASCSYRNIQLDRYTHQAIVTAMPPSEDPIITIKQNGGFEGVMI